MIFEIVFVWISNIIIIEVQSFSFIAIVFLFISVYAFVNPVFTIDFWPSSCSARATYRIIPIHIIFYCTTSMDGTLLTMFAENEILAILAESFSATWAIVFWLFLFLSFDFYFFHLSFLPFYLNRISHLANFSFAYGAISY